MTISEYARYRRCSHQYIGRRVADKTIPLVMNKIDPKAADLALSAARQRTTGRLAQGEDYIPSLEAGESWDLEFEPEVLSAAQIAERLGVSEDDIEEFALWYSLPRFGPRGGPFQYEALTAMMWYRAYKAGWRMAFGRP